MLKDVNVSFGPGGYPPPPGYYGYGYPTRPATKMTGGQQLAVGLIGAAIFGVVAFLGYRRYQSEK